MRFVATLALAVAAALSGCAATVTRDSPAPGASSSPAAPAASAATPTTTPVIAASPAAAKKIFLELKAAGNIGTGEDWQAFVEEWQTAMSAAVSAKGGSFAIAKAGEAPKADTATVVKMVVNDFKYVSQAKRYLVGIFAGNAYMDVDVEYLEYPQGKKLGARKFQTSSSAWQGVFSAMTPKQVEAVANEIVGDLAGR